MAARHLLAHDEEALLRAEQPNGVRLLPPGDPYLAVDRTLVDAASAIVPAPTRDDRGASLTPRLINSLGGRVLVDGRITGTWGRREHYLTIHLWDESSPDRERVLAEAHRFAGPIGKPMQLRWLQ